MGTPQDRLTPRGVIVAVGGGAMLVALMVIWSLAFGPESPATASAGQAPTAARAEAPAPTTQGPRAGAPTTPATTPRPAGTAPAPTTTPSATPTTPAVPASVGPGSAAPDSSATPAQARDLATRALPVIEECAARNGDYERCTTAEQLGSGDLPVGSDPPVPGAVAITVSAAGYYVRAADANGRLWGVHRRSGSLTLRRTCHEADGVTTCAGLHW